MQTFFRSFILSLTRPTYYRDILQARVKFSLKYYIVLSSLLLLISIVAGVLNYSASIRNDFTVMAKEVVQNFPPELVLTISPKGITANKPFPLIAQMPSVLTRSRTLSNSNLKNLAIIDPIGEVADLEKHHALILINNSYVIVNNGTSVQTTPLKDFPGVRLDYPTVHQFSQTLVFVARNAIAFTAGYFGFTGLVSFFIWQLLYLAGFAFGLWLVARTMVGTYIKAWQMSLHSITLPLLISGALEVFVIPELFTGWFLAIHAVFTLYIISRLEK